MKENNELERSDIAIDSELEVDCDIGQEITAYIETWFDVDKKFGIDTASEDGTWLNMYGKYNPLLLKKSGKYTVRRQESSVKISTVTDRKQKN